MSKKPSDFAAMALVRRGLCCIETAANEFYVTYGPDELNLLLKEMWQCCQKIKELKPSDRAEPGCRNPDDCPDGYKCEGGMCRMNWPPSNVLATGGKDDC